MNRLIIVGNGFDLAHGLKTSFQDFITYYCNKAVNTFIETCIYSDPLLELKFKWKNNHFRDKRVILLDDTFEILEGFINREDIIVQEKSVLLRNIRSKMNYSKWVDIEMEYFELLKQPNDARRGGDVNKLNIEFNHLKNELIEYLKIQEQGNSRNRFFTTPMVNCFTQDIIADDTVSFESDEEVYNLYFLNFNYTNTLRQYIFKCQGEDYNTELNHIHGSLDNEFGTPIFGFGDEMDKHYIEFEDLNKNEFYKHIKSFEYFKNRNYFNLLRFIDSNDFQVHIYGHSCGLSDRTMLNEIFEHNNCKSIKIFYHQKSEDENDFTEKTYDISRHFKIKGDMRRIIVPFEKCQAMPQPQKVMEFN